MNLHIVSQGDKLSDKLDKLHQFDRAVF